MLRRRVNGFHFMATASHNMHEGVVEKAVPCGKTLRKIFIQLASEIRHRPGKHHLPAAAFSLVLGSVPFLREPNQ
jgi:hypothetical protein